MKRKKLEIRNLSVEFRTLRGILPVVKNVSCIMYEGMTHTLVGDSGSGKSVLACALMQILSSNGRISGGEVLYYHYKTKDQIEPSRIEKLTSYKRDSKEMCKIRTHYMSMIFQEPMSALSPVHRCGDLIGTAIKVKWPKLSRAEVKKRTHEILEQLLIPDPQKTAKQYSFELSGGMRQRICIALAMICQPEILIADEPTTALDVTTQKEILLLLEKMKQNYGLTILYITHDMGVVAQISNNIIVMQNGTFVEEKKPVILFNNPQHPYSKKLIWSAQLLEKKAKSKIMYEYHNEKELLPVLKVRNLKLSFTNKGPGFLNRKIKSLHALDDVSFNLYKGETLGIAGESGSGKTTIARCITGLYRHYQGKIIFIERNQVLSLGEYKYRKADSLYQHIRMIFQDPYSSLNPRLNIFNNIGEPLLIAGKKKPYIKELIADLLIKVGLNPNIMQRYPHSFSGGERQRICIARAVIMNPTILIADEATAALDVSLRSQVLDLLNNLQRDMKFSILLITHDISTIKYCADRMIVMKEGKIIERGLADTVIDNPQAYYTKILIAAVPSTDPHKRLLPTKYSP
jgi:peptide/nickel transport system ATP-binding protein